MRGLAGRDIRRKGPDFCKKVQKKQILSVSQEKNVTKQNYAKISTYTGIEEGGLRETKKGENEKTFKQEKNNI